MLKKGRLAEAAFFTVNHMWLSPEIQSGAWKSTKLCPFDAAMLCQLNSIRKFNSDGNRRACC